MRKLSRTWKVCLRFVTDFFSRQKTNIITFFPRFSWWNSSPDIFFPPFAKNFSSFSKTKFSYTTYYFFLNSMEKYMLPSHLILTWKIELPIFSSFHSWKNTTKQLFLSENNYFLPCRGEKRWVISFITLRILLYVCHTWEKILAVGILPSYILKNAGWHRQEMQ